MIEWVPIKGWTLDDDRTVLILVKQSGEKEYFSINSAIIHRPMNSKFYSPEFGYFCTTDGKAISGNDYYVSHVAKINFPVEKMLELKWMEYLRSQAFFLPTPELEKLSQIAKEHYEEKK